MDKKKTKPKKVVRFGVSMTKSLCDKLDKMAESEDLTRSGMIQKLIKDKNV